VHLKLSSKVGTVVVPVNALIFRSQGMQVAVIRNNKAELAPITIAAIRDRSGSALGRHRTGRDHQNPSDSLTSGTEVRVAKAAEK